MAAHRKLVFIPGNQLFPLQSLRRHKDGIVFMSEDYQACTYVRHHKHKLVLILSAMRAYADSLRQAGFKVHYEQLTKQPEALSLTDKLGIAVQHYSSRKLVCFEQQDKSMEARLTAFAKRNRLTYSQLPSPMFLTPRSEFREWRLGRQEPRMVDFYKWQRRRLDILMTNGRPSGGRWSFDQDNRKKLPKNMPVPELPVFAQNPHLADVKGLVEMHFAEHAGFTNNFALPTTRREALGWLQDFLEQRFACFGDYEDALSTRTDHAFHSVLSPLLNIGLLTPSEVLREALSFAEHENIAINNVEGFIRQIIGWREFMFGIYCTDGDTMQKGNFWRHCRRLRPDWYQGTTGLTPLDSVIAKANRIGWAHHIERLMVAGNLMLLAEVHPHDVYRWYMELFVDAADWVMVPNVYGMALFADGGTITTKPYVCGANYLRKMGDYSAGDWGTTLDGLFWRFIKIHRPFFERQPRLRMLCGHLDRQSPERRRELTTAAHQFLRSKTGMLPDVA